MKKISTSSPILKFRQFDDIRIVLLCDGSFYFDVPSSVSTQKLEEFKKTHSRTIANFKLCTTKQPT